MSKTQKYVSVTMYDASQGKRISRSLTRSKFRSEKQLQDHIKDMRAKQKEKNRIYKKNHGIDKYKKQLENPLPDENTYGHVILDNINNFHIDKKTGTSTVILGASKRGKTTLMMRLYNKYYKKHSTFICTLFTGNKQIPLYNKNNDKNLLISEGFNKKSEKYIKLQKYLNTETDNRYKFLNMFDDIIDMKYSSLINNLILTYRNSNISTIMCLQYAYLMSKMNRANVNNIIIFDGGSEQAIKDLIDNFLKAYFLNLGLKTYKDQYNFFKEVTNNYGFFYINNHKNIFSIHRILN